MSEETVSTTEEKAVVESTPAPAPVKKDEPRSRSRGNSRGKGRKGGRTREPKEFEEEVLDIARVTRVVKGGRRMRFLATVAIGDKKGRVGLGTGKSVEVSVAIRKAVQEAKKNLVTIDLVNGTIPFDKSIKYKSAKLIMMPAPAGTGVIAGGAFRKIVTLAGITDIYAKSIGTNSPLVSAQASIKALSSFVRHRKETSSEEQAS